MKKGVQKVTLYKIKTFIIELQKFERYFNINKTISLRMLNKNKKF